MDIMVNTYSNFPENRTKFCTCCSALPLDVIPVHRSIGWGLRSSLHGSGLHGQCWLLVDELLKCSTSWRGSSISTATCYLGNILKVTLLILEWYKPWRKDAVSFPCNTISFACGGMPGEVRHCPPSFVNASPILFPFILEYSQETWKIPIKQALLPLLGAGAALAECGHLRGLEHKQSSPKGQKKLYYRHIMSWRIS